MTTSGTEPDSGASAEATGATTLAEVLTVAEGIGYRTEIESSAGRVRCGECDEAVEPSEISADYHWRLEGASDVADMMMVLGVECPRCGARGPLVLGYGPNASESDAAVVQAVDLSSAEPGPVLATG